MILDLIVLSCLHITVQRQYKWSEVAQLCPILCNPLDCSLPGSSVHGIFQAIVLESEKAMAPHSSTLAWKIPWMEEPGRLKSMGSLRAGLSDFTFTFQFRALEKEMATHSSVLAWRIPGTGEPGGLPSLGSHRVGHEGSDLAAAAAAVLEWVAIAFSRGSSQPRDRTQVSCIVDRRFTVWANMGYTNIPASKKNQSSHYFWWGFIIICILRWVWCWEIGIRIYIWVS